MTPISTARPLIIGSCAGLEAPYPLQMEGKVIRGFGRGSEELGIPTANLPVDNSRTSWSADIESGVYSGWASLRLPPSHPNQPTTSIGYGRFFKTTARSAEVHMLYEFEADFYGAEMRLLVAGFIREEKDYDDLQFGADRGHPPGLRCSAQELGIARHGHRRRRAGARWTGVGWCEKRQSRIGLCYDDVGTRWISGAKLARK
ncbi:uncharacterized protein FIBRA_09135 [Fibroporia radiculosa]|uniref:Riboflavin kinase n=1 Tax=Fibroporia radiculosa TaxID=599839 RepID=J4I3W1_9APHY|nr:uncharacterized protein FIBRA_09135 [Fibroporia radiculosa]CCM06832.1 predicted protein [Fibroporia radiculosa]